MKNNNEKEKKKTFIQKYAIIVYIIISYAITWSILFPLSLFYMELDFPIREIWHSFGAVGPAISAIIVLKIKRGNSGLKHLKKSFLRRPSIKYLIFAAFPLIVFLITFSIESFVGTFSFNDFVIENRLFDFSSILLFLLVSISYGFFEEIGWRGYLLPTFQKRFNALISTIILSLIWAFWHLPLFFYRYEDFQLAFFPLLTFCLLLFSGSIVFTFLYNQTKGSLLPVIILHITYDIVTSHQTGIASIVISVIFVILDIIIIVKFRWKNLSENERIIIDEN
ncbi:MAG: CPBP family intramembrane metalloprotease [Promethearchaeota archaeon]|nr:MAG: CPBP family intramembrane metalloprotease [Candidatus Lokiarchaeota archaeon]